MSARSSRTAAGRCSPPTGPLPGSGRKLFQRGLEFCRAEDIPLPETLRGSADVADGVEGKPLIPDGVAVEYGECALQLCLRGQCKRQGVQPLFHLHGLDSVEPVLSPPGFDVESGLHEMVLDSRKRFSLREQLMLAVVGDEVARPLGCTDFRVDR